MGPSVRPPADGSGPADRDRTAISPGCPGLLSARPAVLAAEIVNGRGVRHMGQIGIEGL
jgi:hypothetical protein